MGFHRYESSDYDSFSSLEDSLLTTQALTSSKHTIPTPQTEHKQITDPLVSSSVRFKDTTKTEVKTALIDNNIDNNTADHGENKPQQSILKRENSLVKSSTLPNRLAPSSNKGMSNSPRGRYKVYEIDFASLSIGKRSESSTSRKIIGRGPQFT